MPMNSDSRMAYDGSETTLPPDPKPSNQLSNAKVTLSGWSTPNALATVAVIDQVAASAAVPAKPPTSTAPISRRRDPSSGRPGWAREPHHTISNGSPNASSSSQSM